MERMQIKPVSESGEISLGGEMAALNSIFKDGSTIKFAIEFLEARLKKLRDQVSSTMSMQGSNAWGSDYCSSHRVPILASKSGEISRAITILTAVLEDIKYENLPRAYDGVEFEEYPDEADRYWTIRR